MSPVFIIAEAGVNHNGSLEMALRLVEEARASGADAVKFQTFKAENLATRSAPKAAYQQRTEPGDTSQFDMLKRLELDEKAHRTLIARCSKLSIQFLSSPFDIPSSDLLESLGVPIFKVPSGEITNLPFLSHLARKNRPMIVSTGMSTLGEVEEAVATIRKETSAKLTLLHCVTEYPAPYSEINLRAMNTLRTAFALPVGYSDHSPGIEIALAAVAMGATVIEKHFTLDRTLPGPDHAASLSPQELRQLVSSIRHVESALGTGVKAPAPCEIPNMPVARKSIVASKALRKGHRISRADLAIKRPGSGIAPKHLSDLLKRSLKKSLDKDAVITWDHLA